MRHPDERQIALYAGGDGAGIRRLFVGYHVSHCPVCRESVEAYRRDRETLRQRMGQAPESLDWNRLAAEMTANIRVGLEAGECVPDVPRRSLPVVPAWRPVAAVAGLALLLIFGFYLNTPDEQRQSLVRGVARILKQAPAADNNGVALEATRNGIEVRENGAAMTMMNPGTAPAVVVVNTAGSLRARYVDDDTGQVTITNVYAQ
jgi:hypothetical protein